MDSATLRISAFSICWLRSYDFGLARDQLEPVVTQLQECPLVERVVRIGTPDELDEIDRDLFDIRYLDRTKLVRLSLQSCKLVQQTLGSGRQITATLKVTLLLDTGSGYGVFNICLPRRANGHGALYTIEEICFLSSQWLLILDKSGNPVRLNVCLPREGPKAELYLREIMNFYFLQIHEFAWETAEHGCWRPLQNQDWYVDKSREADPRGCEHLRELFQAHRVRSFFPTSFGPVLNIWDLDGLTTAFKPGEFLQTYATDLAWFFTDGSTRSLGENILRLENEERRGSRALFVWPNHAIYINQDPTALAGENLERRIDEFGLLDVEIARIFEVLNLQTALVHAFDRDLDERLEQVSELTAEDAGAIIRITEERRDISRAIRSFDFFNLFHGAQLEPLFRRLLENRRLKYRASTELVEAKAQHLDEAIQQAVIIQDRTKHLQDLVRQQQQREQELNVLRGLHGLSLANDIQNNALMIINFVVSATAAFTFTQVLLPLLTRLAGATPSFSEAYPELWVGLNLGIFAIVIWFLRYLNSWLVQLRRRGVEIEGRLNLPYNFAKLQSYMVNQKGLEYFHFDTQDASGYLRLHKAKGVLTLEFDRERFYRFVFFFQGAKPYTLEALRKSYVERELQEFEQQVT